jgi:hypothetical protein
MEFIIHQPKVPAPTTKNPNLLPRFVALIKNVDPKKVIRDPTNIIIPVIVRFAESNDLIMSRIRLHSS